MNRRDFLRRFILTLLALVFGPRVYELIDPDELENFVGFAVDRWPSNWGKAQALTPELFAQIVKDIAESAPMHQPNLIIVPPQIYDEVCAMVDDGAFLPPGVPRRDRAMMSGDHLALDRCEGRK